MQHWRRLELTAADNAADWLALLDGVDAVVYAAGLLREHRQGEFDAIHGRGSIALAGAAASAGIRRIVLISALGAGEAVDAGFLGSRVAAEKPARARTGLSSCCGPRWSTASMAAALAGCAGSPGCR